MVLGLQNNVADRAKKNLNTKDNNKDRGRSSSFSPGNDIQTASKNEKNERSNSLPHSNSLDGNLDSIGSEGKKIYNNENEGCSDSDSGFPKTHDFVITNYYKPTNCVICQQLLVGLVKQGFQCTHCKLNFHKKCKELSPVCGEIEYVCKPTEHIIKTATYGQPTYCDECGKMLLGFVNQGKRCKICKHNFHSDCIKKIMDPDNTKGSNLTESKFEMPEVAATKCESLKEKENKKKTKEGENPEKTAKFGMEIEQLASMENKCIPNIITSSIYAIEQKTEWLQEEGIYRLSGTQSIILALKENYNNMEDLNLVEVKNIHDICGLLKLYLRELPEPLFTFASYEKFTAVIDQPQDKQEELFKDLITKLPTVNKGCIITLFDHLVKLKEFEKVNLMTSTNLAVCFAPTVMRNPDDSVFSATDLDREREVIRNLLDKWPLKNLTNTNEEGGISLNSETEDQQCLLNSSV